MIFWLNIRTSSVGNSGGTFSSTIALKCFWTPGFVVNTMKTKCTKNKTISHHESSWFLLSDLSKISKKLCENVSRINLTSDDYCVKTREWMLIKFNILAFRWHQSIAEVSIYITFDISIQSTHLFPFYEKTASTFPELWYRITAGMTKNIYLFIIIIPKGIKNILVSFTPTHNSGRCVAHSEEHMSMTDPPHWCKKKHFCWFFSAISLSFYHPPAGNNKRPKIKAKSERNRRIRLALDVSIMTWNNDN